MKSLITILLILTTLTSSAQYRHKRKHYNVDGLHNNYVTVGFGMMLGGVVFTGASILEGNKNYVTYKPNPNNPNSPIQVVTPFWQQTPRQIVFTFGVGLTVTGLITMLVNK